MTQRLESAEQRAQVWEERIAELQSAAALMVAQLRGRGADARLGHSVVLAKSKAQSLNE